MIPGGGGSGGGGSVQQATPEKTSMALAAVNFANGVVGAGIVGLPFAFNQMGLPLGVVSCVLVATCSQYTIRLLAELGSAHGLSNYLDLAQRAFGAPGYYMCSLFQGAFAFGAMVTYLIIFADTMPDVLMDLSPGKFNDMLGLRRSVLAIAGVLVLLPLSLIRSFGSLARLGLFKMFATLFLAVMACAYAVVIPRTDNDSEYTFACKYTSVHRDYFPALGTIAFAFVCHHQTFLVQGSLKNPTPRRFAITTSLAIFGSFSLSLAVAVAGYVTFFENIKGDLFTSYSLLGNKFPSPGVLTTARLLLALNMIITYPGELMVARQTIESILSRVRKTQRWKATMDTNSVSGMSGSSSSMPSSSMPSSTFDVAKLAESRALEEVQSAMAADTWAFGTPIPPSIKEHVVITTGLFLASLTIGLLVTDISTVLNLTGSTAAVFLSFLFPAAIRIRLGADANDSEKWYSMRNFFPLLVLAFGTVAFVASSGISVVNLALGASSEANESKQC